MPAPWGDYLSLARFCLATNQALFAFLDGPIRSKRGGFLNKRARSRIETGLQFLLQFTKEGVLIRKLPEYTFYPFCCERKEEKHRLTGEQIGLVEGYIKTHQGEFELAERSLRRISERWFGLRSRETKEKLIRPCVSFFKGLLGKCLWASHCGVN